MKNFIAKLCVTAGLLAVLCAALSFGAFAAEDNFRFSVTPSQQVYQEGEIIRFGIKLQNRSLNDYENILVQMYLP